MQTQPGKLFWWNTVFNLFARLPFTPQQPRQIRQLANNLWQARFADGRSLHFVTPRRIRLYGRGYFARLFAVASRYGAESAFQIEPGQQLVEVGANIGEFSLYAAHKGAKVFAIEPDRLNLEALQRNCAAMDAITIMPLACAEAAGEATFYAYPEGADSSLIEPDKYSDKYTVKTERLDHLIDSAGIDRIDLLKCDAEGAEPEVLRGAIGILPRVRRITIDVSPERQGASTESECRQILDQAGFRLKSFHKGRILIGER